MNHAEITKIVDNKIRTSEIPSIPTAKLILKAEIQLLLCVNCIVVTDLSKPIAKNIDATATKVVTRRASFFTSSVFLFGIKYIRAAPTNGRAPTRVNKLMHVVVV